MDARRKEKDMMKVNSHAKIYHTKVHLLGIKSVFSIFWSLFPRFPVATPFVEPMAFIVLE